MGEFVGVWGSLLGMCSGVSKTLTHFSILWLIDSFLKHWLIRVVRLTSKRLIQWRANVSVPESLLKKTDLAINFFKVFYYKITYSLDPNTKNLSACWWNKNVSQHELTKSSTLEAFNDAEKFDIKYFSETHSDLKFYSDDNTRYLDGYKLIRTNHLKNIIKQWKIKTEELFKIIQIRNVLKVFVVLLSQFTNQISEKTDEFFSRFENIINDIQYIIKPILYINHPELQRSLGTLVGVSATTKKVSWNENWKFEVILWTASKNIRSNSSPSSSKFTTDLLPISLIWSRKVEMKVNFPRKIT